MDFNVGDHVLETNRINGSCRVVAKATGIYGVYYEVRELANPDRVVWTDITHLDPLNDDDNVVEPVIDSGE